MGERRFGGAGIRRALRTSRRRGTPLPDDPVFGGMGSDEGFYLFRTEEYLAFMGSDCTLCQNGANPGTHDVDFSAAPPAWISDGIEGAGCIQCVDADGEKGSVSDYSTDTGIKPTIYVVAQLDALNAGYHVFASRGNRRDVGYDVSSGNWVGYNGGGGLVNSGTAPDTDLHLHETSGAANLVRHVDGTAYTGSADSGLTPANATFVIGGASGVLEIDGRIAEVAIYADTDETRMALLRAKRIAKLYPSIALA